VNDVAFSPSENRIATAGGDQFIKVWDPRDGTYVYRLVGHTGAVLSLRYTSTEQFLVSGGSDAQIFIWSLLTKSVQRILRGHIDLVYRISISSDCSLIVSSSNDGTAKSWSTTPRHPDPPQAPKVITVTDTTALISWTAPPCFNCDVTAFHYQYRVGFRGEWVPTETGQSLAPHLRNRVVENLIPATHYQFRIRAENRMGKGDWSPPSQLVRTNFGLPEKPEKPIVCQVLIDSMIVGWFTASPHTFGSASTSFQIQSCGDGKDFEDTPVRVFTYEESVEIGRKILRYFDKIKTRYEQTKDALIKSQGFLLMNRQSEEEKKEFPISIELPLDTILTVSFH
jgi:WD40 repeat protein